MAVDRRQLIQILSAGAAAVPAAVAQHEHGKASVALQPYAPRALSEEEYKIVDRLSDILLPTDELSPGAHAAGVARYIDIVLLYGEKPVLTAWKTGIASIDTSSQSTYKASFLHATEYQQISLVESISKQEAQPSTESEKFFVALKRLTIEAFYLSSAGKQSLGYKGDTAIASFPGCTHPQHG